MILPYRVAPFFIFTSAISMVWVLLRCILVSASPREVTQDMSLHSRTFASGKGNIEHATRVHWDTKGQGNGDGIDTSWDEIYCTRMSPGLDAWRCEVGNSSTTGCTSLCRPDTGTLLHESTSNMHASGANIWWNQVTLSSDASAVCYPWKGYSTNQLPRRRGPSDTRLKIALTQKEPHNYTSSKTDNSASPFKHIVPVSSQTETNLMNAPNFVSTDQSVKLSDISTLLPKMSEASKQNIPLQNLLSSASLAASQPFAGLEVKGHKRSQQEGGKGKEAEKSLNRQGDSVHAEKQGEDPRVMMFKVSLAEMVVELLKPAWEEGHMSREEHKSLAKRIVDKVMRALQGTSIPTTEKSIEEYLALSKPRIGKLVEEYVEYQKALQFMNITGRKWT